MKKILSVLLLLIAVLIAGFYLTNQAYHKPLTSEQTNEAAQSLLPSKTNSIDITSNQPTAQIEPETTSIIGSVETLTNGLTATNIEQWKTAIKKLHKSPGLLEDWDMEMTNRTSGIPIPLIANGQAVSYKARFINISIKNKSGDILEVQLHSPIMNIDETRALGLQLCNTLGQDPSDFLAWCDKVGNHWLDAPLFFSKSTHDPNSNKIFEFKTLMTYTDEKPWYIDFIIMSP